MKRGRERGRDGGRERGERERGRERERSTHTHTYPSFESGLPQKCPCGTLSYTGGPRCVHCGGGKYKYTFNLHLESLQHNI